MITTPDMNNIIVIGGTSRYDNNKYSVNYILTPTFKWEEMTSETDED